MTNTQTYYVSHEVSEEIFIERYDFIFEELASYYEAINEGPEEFNLVEVERDKLMAWQLDVSLEPVLGMACKALQKPEELLQISESTALTFTSNHACRGMWTQASESKNSVPDSKTLQ